VGPLLLALQIPRPFESIINIYCPWHPETSASPNSRITVLDELRKRYMDLAWRLMISMLPESHELHIPTHEPDYTDWKLDQKGIDQQIAKAEKAVAGQAAVKRNRFVQLTGATKSINQTLKAKARSLAGLKGYLTNLEAPTAEYVLTAYHQLWQIEKSFRMSKTDLRARPICHHKRDSIEAHLTIVLAALAVSHWLEHQTGWSIRKLVKTLRRYRSIAVQTGDHILHAGTHLDDATRAAVNAVKNAATGH